MDRKFDYLIIGGGVSGLTLCKKLREKGKRVIVLEAKDVPGGLCTTKNINGHQLDVGGGHFFFAKHQAIFDYIFGPASQRPAQRWPLAGGGGCLRCVG